jgi:hypothetical protein
MSTDVSEVRAASIIRAMSTSETSVDIQLRTQQYIPEDSELHIRRSENLKRHKQKIIRDKRSEHLNNIQMWVLRRY